LPGSRAAGGFRCVTSGGPTSTRHSSISAVRSSASTTSR
ncbi:MAG: Mobile element protein, partial [uncultured Chloroflexia bacterium]